GGGARGWRLADGIVDARRELWIGVREDHTAEARAGGQPVNTIVAVDLRAPDQEAGRILAAGHDFFSSPRLSPDGNALIWLAWDHPNMPWNGTTLWLGRLAADGTLTGEPRAIAGGPSESVFQPEWSPDGNIVFVSDRSGWWNLYRFDLATGATEAIVSKAAEFGQPQWVFGMSTYAFAGPDRIVCTFARGGLWTLATIDLRSRTLRTIETPFTEFGSVRAEGESVVFRAGAPALPGCIVRLDLASDRH